MKYEEAVRLNADGKLTRKVLTERGWYIPSPPEVPPDAPPDIPPAPLMPAPLPIKLTPIATKHRGRPRKAWDV